MKKLKIKESKNEEEAVIELERYAYDKDGVKVKINGVVVATFLEDGKFWFFGKDYIPRYKGRWDE